MREAANGTVASPRHEQHSNIATGYDFCNAVRDWLRGRRAGDSSVCEELLDIGDEYIGDEHVSWAREIGPANVFYSHMQKLGIDETLYTLDLTGLQAFRFGLACRTRRYWVDYVVIRQLAEESRRLASRAGLPTARQGGNRCLHIAAPRQL